MFFVLSGMVILRSLGGTDKRLSAGQFLASRAGRLLPVYAIALLAGVVALSCGDPFRAMPWLIGNRAAHDIAEAVWPQPWLGHLAAHVTLTQGLLPPAVLPDAEFTILGPAWSLSTEWQFYLVVAVVLACRRSRAARLGDWRVFAGVMMGVGALGILVDLLPGQWQPGRAFLPHEAWYFALGIASHGLLASGGTRTTRWWWGLSLAATILLQWQQTPMMASAVPMLWIACLLCEAPKVPALARPLATVLHAPLLQWLGSISYPLYLIHMPIQRLLMLALAPIAVSNVAAFALLWGPAAVLLPLIVAYALHRWVEVPCWQWARHRARQIRTTTGKALRFERRAENLLQPIDGA